MADGKQREAWNHTAHLLAMIDNRMIGKRDSSSKPSDFHPFLLREKRQREQEEMLPNPFGIHVLKVFLPKE